MIPIFEELLPDAKYVVNVRTGLQEVRLHEIQEKMPAPVRRVSLNGIKPSERQTFKHLLDEAGLLGSNLAHEIDKGGDYREIVTTIYNHEGIRTQLAEAIKPLLADSNTHRILITSLLLSWIGQKFEPALLRAVTERDPYAELKRHEIIAAEIFKLDDNDLEVRSPLFAEYVLREHCASDDLLAVIEKLIVIAVRRKRERGFQGILSKLMRVATLKTVIVGVKGLDTIESLFQNLQRDIEVNKEPLFWLQYAILESEMKNFAEAESFLDTAYKRAESSPGFQTFQIDTYALRLLLRIEELNSSKDVIRFEQILTTSELVLSMITDQNRRFHAIQVLEGFEPFVKARAHVMSVSERNAMVFQLSRLESALSGLSSEIRAETGSDLIKRSLARSREYIVKSS